MSLQRHSIFDTRPSSLLSLAATATLVLTASACTTAGDAEDTADLVLRGGRVVTVDEAPSGSAGRCDPRGPDSVRGE